jgi:hypothetical protein
MRRAFAPVSQLTGAKAHIASAAAVQALRTPTQREFILTLDPEPSWAPGLHGVDRDRVSPGH